MSDEGGSYDAYKEPQNFQVRSEELLPVKNQNLHHQSHHRPRSLVKSALTTVTEYV